MQARWFFAFPPAYAAPARESLWSRLARRYIAWAEACHGAMRGSRALG
jgi:hypothetical protein